jgi:hypothetical protein
VSWLLVWHADPLRIPLSWDASGRLVHAFPRNEYDRYATRARAEEVRLTDPDPEALEVWDVDEWEEFMAQRSRVRQRQPKPEESE